MNTSQFFKDKSGQFSSMRLFMLLVCAACMVDWMHAVFTTGVWKPQPEVLFFIATVIGIKYLQKEKEGTSGT